MNSNKPEMRMDEHGTREWYLNGERHREDGPAVEKVNGTREWYLNGKLHREDGPAVERPDDDDADWMMPYREWYRNGMLHREDGPAIEYKRSQLDGGGLSGNRKWYLNGELHRKDGPAIEWAGSRWWYLNGKRHREDGPAIEWESGARDWYYKDTYVRTRTRDSLEEFQEEVRLLQIREVQES